MCGKFTRIQRKTKVYLGVGGFHFSKMQVTRQGGKISLASDTSTVKRNTGRPSNIYNFLREKNSVLNNFILTQDDIQA